MAGVMTTLVLVSILIFSGSVLAAPLHPKAKEREIAKFQAMDQNRDGKVGPAEFSAARGGDSKAVRQEFTWHDLNRDGFITLDEFLADPPRKPIPGKPGLRY